MIMGTAGQGAVSFIRQYREAGVPTQFNGLSEVSSRELASELGGANWHTRSS